MVGELVAGILLLGPALLKLCAPSPAMDAASDVAVFLIVLGAGMKMDTAHLLKGFRGRGLGVLVLNFLLPLGLCMGAGWGFGLGLLPSFVLGLCVSVTALPVAVRLLEELGLLQSLTARYALAAALSSDILTLLPSWALLDGFARRRRPGAGHGQRRAKAGRVLGAGLGTVAKAGLILIPPLAP